MAADLGEQLEAATSAASFTPSARGYARAVAKGREQWRRVRRRRAEPPALAGQAEDRKQVFQSALSQAEELWDAAAVAGPASRPLPLFYCISQAGRAVCAAWTREERWRPRAHGLRRRESNAQMPEARVFDYAAAVTRQPLGSYAMVASATASPTFSGFATVAELWASLPGWPTPDSIFGDRPRCLTLEPIRAPGDERSLLQRLTAPAYAAVHPLRMAVEELPIAYPTMAGIEQDHTRTRAFGPPEPVFRFVDDDGSLRSLADVGVRPFWSEGVSRDFVVRPRVGDAATAPAIGVPDP
jgi:YaaC-like Protein